MTRIWLSGASGFVGSHVLRHFLTNIPDAHLVCPVTFRHRGNSDRLADAVQDHPEWRDRVTVMMHDLTAPASLTTIDRLGEIDFMVNVASESHVDRSITEPVPFIRNNVDLMLNVLELARVLKPKALLQVSTDEVYGPAPAGHDHVEWETLLPSNPYSASKAAQESIAFSYWRTYGVPLILTNTMNIVGETQDREKFVPMAIRALLAGDEVPVHVSPTGVAGSRFYLHARNQADALLHIMTTQKPVLYPDADRPLRFNVVGEREVTNVEMVEMLAGFLGVKAKIRPVDFHSSRPGHDLRYALDGSKLAEAGWTPPIPLDESLRRTVEWSMNHPEWLL